MRPFNLNLPEKLRNAVSDPDFRCFVNQDDERFEILIADEIGEGFFGEGVRAVDVIESLDARREDPVDVRINSPGGLVYEGFQIFNALARHRGHVTTINEGLAFSSAANIFMAGDTRLMFPASDFGIHRASGFAFGNARVMRGVAEWLDAIDSHLVEDIYAGLGHSAEQINQWLDGTDDGTIFTGRQAVEMGFATGLVETEEATNRSKAAAASKRLRAQYDMRIRQLKKRRA